MPMGSPVIPDGAVRIDGGRIAAAGRWQDLRSDDAEDLGDVVLLPGLINAHCHLDYTAMRGAILSAASFPQWIRRLNELKRTQSDDEYLAAIAAGFAELKRWGTTSVFNIESFPELMVRMPAPPIRTWWFYELLDIRNRIHTDDVVAGALAFFETRSDWLGGFGLSPHAPYTTSLPLYGLVRECCERSGMPMMTHLAESQEEFAMFAESRGALYDFLAPLGRDMTDTGGTTPVRRLFDGGVVPRRAILTHMNVLAEADWTLLAGRAGDVSVVHCPNCHAYFGRPPFPLERHRNLGVNLCLGTDSLASNRSLSLFEEIRTLLHNHPSVAPRVALEMVTLNPARAIGRAGSLGEITPGACADLIAIPFSGRESGAAETIAAFSGDVPWMMVAGQRVKAAGPEAG